MQHEFQKKEFPKGQFHVVETCLYCPETRIRYQRDGAIRYRHADGLSRKSPERRTCTGVAPVNAENKTKTLLSKETIKEAAASLNAPTKSQTRHQWQHVEMKAQENSVRESCICGAQRVRYRSGQAAAINQQGKVEVGYRVACTRVLNVAEIIKREKQSKPKPAKPAKAPQPASKVIAPMQPTAPVPPTVEIKNPTPETIEEFKRLWEQTPTLIGVVPDPDYFPRNLRKSIHKETLLDRIEAARLTEALVLINVMYEALVQAGNHTNARYMAGRYLYSQGYMELVRKIDPDHAEKMAPKILLHGNTNAERK